VNRYDAVLLDAFGTLITLDRPAQRLRASLRSRLAIEVDEPRAAHAMRVEIGHYARHCRTVGDRDALAALRLECAGIVDRELELQVGAERMLAVLADAIAPRPYPDVAPALGGLERRGVAVAVVSNGDCSLAETLRAAGLGIELVFDSATSGSAKPDPGIFRQALARLGVAAARALHVGDDERTDLAGARAAGIDAVLLDRGGQSRPDGWFHGMRGCWTQDGVFQTTGAPAGQAGRSLFKGDRGVWDGPDQYQSRAARGTNHLSAPRPDRRAE
jgi:putative hydrolase of the HAD superfamily